MKSLLLLIAICAFTQFSYAKECNLFISNRSSALVRDQTKFLAQDIMTSKGYQIVEKKKNADKTVTIKATWWVTRKGSDSFTRGSAILSDNHNNSIIAQMHEKALGAPGSSFSGRKDGAINKLVQALNHLPECYKTNEYDLE